MTDKQKNVDALLGASANHMLRAAELTQQARVLQRSGSRERYWYITQQIYDELATMHHCFCEAQSILFVELGLEPLPDPFAPAAGGMIQ